MTFVIEKTSTAWKFFTLNIQQLLLGLKTIAIIITIMITNASEWTIIKTTVLSTGYMWHGKTYSYYFAGNYAKLLTLAISFKPHQISKGKYYCAYSVDNKT